MNRKPFWPDLLAAVIIAGCLICLAMLLAGCGTAPAKEPPGPPPAIIVPCDMGQELAIPTGTNSNQLEQLLYTAYLEARALLAACAAQRENTK